MNAIVIPIQPAPRSTGRFGLIAVLARIAGVDTQFSGRLLSFRMAVMAQNSQSNKALVLALDDQERIAALNRDVPALERLWSEQLAVNAPNNQVVIGRPAVLDAFVHGGVINFSRFDREIEFSLPQEGFVVLLGSETVVPLTDAPSVGLVAGRATKRRFTHIWHDEGGQWRLLARHANVIPSK